MNLNLPVYDYKLPISYGDTFYKVVSRKNERFTTPCPSCGDSRTITYKGIHQESEEK